MLESDLLASPPGALPLAETVQEAILGRLELLSPVARQVIEATAVRRRTDLAGGVYPPVLHPTGRLVDKTGGTTHLL